MGSSDVAVEWILQQDWYFRGKCKWWVCGGSFSVCCFLLNFTKPRAKAPLFQEDHRDGPEEQLCSPACFL